MARHFDITTPSSTATVDADGTTHIVFTVTNTTQKPQRASLRPKPLDATQANWLAITGDAERDFPVGFTHQVEVVFKAPPQPPTGPCRFRLDAVSVANPDDDTSEGQPVSVAVKPVAKAEAEKKSLWWLWVLIGLLVLVVLGVVLWLVLRKPAPTGGETPPEPPKPPASAASKPQDPPPAQSVIVPNGLAGLPFADAKKRLEAMGLGVTRETRDIVDDCPDKVITSNPTPGVSVLAGSPVTLTVGQLASGPDTCKPGYVWREAFAGDTVCVTPESRQRAATDNQAQPSRTQRVPGTPKDIEHIMQTNPKAGAIAKGDFAALARIDPRVILAANNPMVAYPTIVQCMPGWVERRANPLDHVCVSEATVVATDAENKVSDSHKACPR